MGLTVEKCLQAWTNSLKQMNAKADIVFFGDSLVYYGDFASLFPNKVVCNLGLRGDTLQGMVSRVEQVRLVQPEKVFLMAGINDVASCQADEFQDKYETLLDALRKQLPLLEIIVQSLLPVNDSDFTISCSNIQIERCNERIKKLSAKDGLKYIDLYDLYSEEGRLAKSMTVDGLHLKPEGYERWYEVLKNE